MRSHFEYLVNYRDNRICKHVVLFRVLLPIIKQIEWDCDNFAVYAIASHIGNQTVDLHTLAVLE